MMPNESKNNIDLLKTTAHDLNNIFTSVLNSIELLKIKSMDDEQLLLIKNIETNSLRASEIINSILLSKTDKKKLIAKLSVKNLIYDLELTLKRTFGTTVKFGIIIDNNVDDVYGNYSELFRVLLNLCMNAKEAIGKNGVIKISASNVVQSKTNNLFKLKNKKFIQIEVSDDGSGINDKDINRIFNSEFSTKNTNKISGLGLSIVKQIIDEHHGFIKVESELGIGTKFKIYLPAFQKRTKASKSLQPKAILIAEDSKEIADELFELLSYENYLPTVSYDGKTVLNLINKGKKFDLFIIDKKMPGINGIELIKRIREKNSAVPIILATGSIPSDEEQILNNLQINKYLKKPYLFDVLLQNIKDLF